MMLPTVWSANPACAVADAVPDMGLAAQVATQSERAGEAEWAGETAALLAAGSVVPAPTSRATPPRPAARRRVMALTDENGLTFPPGALRVSAAPPSSFAPAAPSLTASPKRRPC